MFALILACCIRISKEQDTIEPSPIRAPPKQITAIRSENEQKSRFTPDRLTAMPMPFISQASNAYSYPPMNLQCPYPPQSPYPTQMPVPSGLPYPATVSSSGLNRTAPYPHEGSMQQKPTAPYLITESSQTFPPPYSSLNSIQSSAPYPIVSSSSSQDIDGHLPDFEVLLRNK
ncbi:hypothetical protein ACKWTF_014198 [Chironomus riparius]